MTITCHVLEARAVEWREVDATLGQSLMRSIKDAGADIEAACEGSLACGTCLVHVDLDWLPKLPPPAADESDLLGWLTDRRPNSRLACQIRASAELDGIRLVIAG